MAIRGLLAAIAAAALAAFVYIWFVYSTVPLIAYWRTIWIETAMTTGSHTWLATSFIPEEIVDDVMKNSSPTANGDILRRIKEWERKAT